MCAPPCMGKVEDILRKSVVSFQYARISGNKLELLPLVSNAFTYCHILLTLHFDIKYPLRPSFLGEKNLFYEWKIL